MTEKKYNAPAAAKTLKIIEYMANQSSSVGVSDLAEALDITVNSTYRILHEMEHMGYVYKTSRQKFGLTPRLYYIGRMAQPDKNINHYVLPLLQELAESTGETSLFCRITDEYKVLLNEQIESPLPLKFVSKVGYEYEAHVSALGKVILAFYNGADISNFFTKNELSKKTENSITSKSKFIEELATIAKKGYAFDDEESLDGVFCIGAPIFGCEKKPIMSIGISGPKSRVISVLEDNIKAVVDTAKKLSIMLGEKY